jgi:membrane-bound lytic murein transglycosylase D
LAALAACGGANAPRPGGAPMPMPAPADGADAAPGGAPSARPGDAVARIALDAPTVPVEVPHIHTPGVEWDLEVHPYEQHERVQHYVRVFSGPARAQFLEWLGRGERYRPLIHERLRAAGLPEDLYYLALVESGYESHAVSHAGAVGMWQFMAPTARELGLRVDWWVDERRDPVRATESAARMLRWMRKEFGSTFVAAAAYNGGPGRVQRGLSQLALAADSSTGDSRFFALSENALLRAETQNYVPQLIAAALVAKDTLRYGLVPARRAPYAYDSVRVPALTPLAAVARAAGASRAELLDLNPQLLRGMTPPGASTPLRLPVGAADGFARRLAALDEKERRPFRVGVTRKRETLEGLAARLDASPALLEAFNGRLVTVTKGRWKGRLVAGQSVRVPTDAVRAYARALTSGEAPGLPALPPADPEPPPRATRVAQRAGAKDAPGASKDVARASKDAPRAVAAAEEPSASARRATRDDDGLPRVALATIAPTGRGDGKPGTRAAAKATSRRDSADAPGASRAAAKDAKAARTARASTPTAKTLPAKEAKASDAKASDAKASADAPTKAKASAKAAGAKAEGAKASHGTAKPSGATTKTAPKAAPSDAPTKRAADERSAPVRRKPAG